MDRRSMDYARALAELIRVRTVSGAGDEESFRRFHELLRRMFPRLFAAAETEEFAGSLLLRWPGRDGGKDPVLLMSHHDVVEATGPWTHPPFAGDIAEGKLWGRGTLDTKGSLFAMLTAAEELLGEGFRPDRDVYFASGRNEETTGAGADAISRTLAERGVRFYMTLDEGGMMLYDPIGGADGTFAMVGVGEKGCADLRFTARSRGGHASTPGRDTPLVRLGRFMAAAEKSHMFRVELSPTVREMFRRAAPYTKGSMGFVFAHAGLFRAVMCRVMPGMSPTAGAMVRTTLAFTMCQGSDGRNVLPQEAWVIGNMRYSHHQGREDSIRAVKALADRFDVQTQVLEGGFESPVTPWDGEPFRLVERAVETVFPGVTALPYIMTGASDSRFFSRVSDHCLRFAPFSIDQAQLDSIHGVDENVDVACLAPAVDFYKYILREA